MTQLFNKRSQLGSAWFYGIPVAIYSNISSFRSEPIWHLTVRGSFNMEEICVFHSTWVFHKSQYQPTSIRSSEVSFITLTLVHKIEIAKNNFSEIEWFHVAPCSLGEFDTGRCRLYIRGCQEDQKLGFFPRKSPKESRSGGLTVGVNSLRKVMCPKEAQQVPNILRSLSRAQGKCRHKMLPEWNASVLDSAGWPAVAALVPWDCVSCMAGAGQGITVLVFCRWLARQGPEEQLFNDKWTVYWVTACTLHIFSPMYSEILNYKCPSFDTVESRKEGKNFSAHLCKELNHKSPKGVAMFFFTKWT